MAGGFLVFEDEWLGIVVSSMEDGEAAPTGASIASKNIENIIPLQLR